MLMADPNFFARGEQIIRYCQNETCDLLSRFLFVFLRDKSLRHLININCQKRIIIIDMATFVQNPRKIDAANFVCQCEFPDPPTQALIAVYR
jgi:hypothetical protein